MAMPIRKLASQTAIYGLSSMVGRFINFLLVPLYTARLAGVDDYGVVSVMFSYAAFLGVIYTYGMETAFFNFARKEIHPQDVFSTGFRALLISTGIFSLFAFMFSAPIAAWVGYPGRPEYIWCFAGILAADALTALPFAYLRYREKAMRFAGIKLSGIGINVLANLFCLLILPELVANGWGSETWVRPGSMVLYIFLSNLLASVVMLLLLSGVILNTQGNYLWPLLKEMFSYGLPLIWVGLAGMVNETMDRILLKKMLPPAEADYQAGIYSAFYKLAMVLSIFIQAFRFAAEPFFFANSNQQDAPKLYARVMRVFLWVVLGIALCTLLFADWLAPLLLRNPAYFADTRGMAIVPILLLANLFLGVYYNLSIWYKLSGQTRLGARVAMGGAAATILLNIWFIPQFGFIACAWITLLVYAGMVLVSWQLGRKHYPVPYNYLNALLASISAVGVYLIWVMVSPNYQKDPWPWAIAGFVCMSLYIAVFIKSEVNTLPWKKSK